MYRDQGRTITNRQGKELCDLLVVCGNHIIIFSDKDCVFQAGKDVNVAWNRWFKAAIWKSAQQTWGAERWMKEHPLGIYLDSQCTKPLPIDLPDPAKAKFHLVVVAHGISEELMRQYDGSGSLIISSKLKGQSAHSIPFNIGDLDPSKSFVHVLDDSSLHILMQTRDTISDFVAYLEKRAALLRAPTRIYATGEEELLAIYLKNMNAEGEHDFVFPLQDGQQPNVIALFEGHWEEFQQNPQRIAQVIQNKISYVWDDLIEKFSHHALRGDQYFTPPGGFKDSEKILRFMAVESRFKRRCLAQALKEMLQTTSPNQRRLRIMPPVSEGEPHYVLLLFPVLASISEEQYRQVRHQFLYACCLVTRLTNPDAKDIVGFATESGQKLNGRSEDACYFDGRTWSDEMEKEAQSVQERWEILKSPKISKFHADEYPNVPLEMKIKNPRNKKCPCGSGKKYKYCCLNK